MDETADEEVTTEELHDAFIQAALAQLNTSFPAKVTAYDASKQTVDCEPALNRSLPDGQGGFLSESIPKLASVRVVFPRSGEYALSFPIKAGDYVLVTCCQRNLAAWRQSGAGGDPGDVGMHTLDGAVAIPGLFPDAKALKSADANNMIIGSDVPAAGASRIEIKPSTSPGINLGAGATKGVARNGDTAACGVLEILGGVGTAFGGLQYTAPDGTVTSISATGVPINLAGKINSSSSTIKAVD